METYVSCKKYIANENLCFRKTKGNRLMFLSDCALCGKEKSTFINNQELNNLNNILNGWFKMKE